MIPQNIRNAAIALKATVGRQYDSQGKHIAFYYQVTPEWRVYRVTASGMMALLRQVKNSKQANQEE